MAKFFVTTGATAYNAFCDLTIEEGDKNVFNGRKSIYNASFDATTSVFGEAFSSFAAKYIKAGFKSEINSLEFSTFDPGQQKAIQTAYSYINNDAPEYYLNTTFNASVGTAKAEYENKNKSNSNKKQIQKLTPPQELIRGIELKNERQNILTPLSTNSVKKDYQYKKPKS